MSQKHFSGSTQISSAGIKKHFQTKKPYQAIFELVWNGLDAQATKIDITVKQNNMDGLETVEIIDNGVGIDFHNITKNFGRFNESSKASLNQHGSQGRGRLTFHKLCHKAVWYTRFQQENAKISVTTDSLHDYEGDMGLSDAEQLPKLIQYDQGTVVVLSTCHGNLQELNALKKLFSIEFSWYLIINRNKEIRINGEKIQLAEHNLIESIFENNEFQFDIKSIRWHEKPTSQKSFNYLLNSSSTTVYKKHTSFNQKGEFWLSNYTTSSWANNFTELEEDCFNETPHNLSSPVFKELNKFIANQSRQIYIDYLQKHAEEEIKRFDKNGYFPVYQEGDSEYNDWKKNHLKSVVKSIYIAEPLIFKSLNSKQGKILIRLLDKLTVSSENSSLFEILESVLDLEEEQMNTFAQQLKKSKLDHIISTIEVLQNRDLTIQKLTELMNKHYKEVLETPDLQKIIENNTWLFGPQYTIIGAEEDDFQKTAKKLRDEVRGIEDITDEDIADGATVTGVRGQVDLFLARKIPQCDDKGQLFYKCIIIEIKRPGVSLNSKHLDQLSRYEEIIAKHPAFGSASMRFELILVGRKISKDDYQITRQLSNMRSKGEQGLVSSSEDGNIKAYVKNWYTIFDNFNLSNSYLLKELKTKRDRLESIGTKELVSELQS